MALLGLSSTPKQSLAIHSAIGTLDLRTPAEETEFQECEAIVREGWAHVARVGEALVRIRDKKLFKNEHPSFELYCRERWGFGRAQACRYIAAGDIQRSLAAVPGMPVPECEAQIRPLIGLSAVQAHTAWVAPRKRAAGRGDRQSAGNPTTAGPTFDPHENEGVTF
jgi:hypothetical protein